MNDLCSESTTQGEVTLIRIIILNWTIQVTQFQKDALFTVFYSPLNSSGELVFSDGLDNSFQARLEAVLGERDVSPALTPLFKREKSPFWRFFANRETGRLP